MGYIRTILKGKFGSTEVWSSSINWGIFGVAVDTPNQALTDSILSKLNAWTVNANTPTNIKTLISIDATINSWRVELRGEDERLLSFSEGPNASTVNGSQTSTKTPQDCVVLSLRTHTPGGRGRGRIYFPAVGATLSSSWFLVTPPPASLVTDFKTWLNGVGVQINAGFAALSMIQTVVLSVRSTRDHVCRDVTSLQVGNVLDTQRRRRDALIETYSAVSYP